MHALAAEFSPSIMQVNNRYSCFLHSNSFCTRPAESHSNVSHFSIGFGLGNRPWTSICFVANEITEVNRSFVWWKAKWEGGGVGRDCLTVQPREDESEPAELGPDRVCSLEWPICASLPSLLGILREIAAFIGLAQHEATRHPFCFFFFL